MCNAKANTIEDEPLSDGMQYVGVHCLPLDLIYNYDSEVEMYFVQTNFSFCIC